MSKICQGVVQAARDIAILSICFMFIFIASPAYTQLAVPLAYDIEVGKCSTFISDTKARGDVGKALYFSWAQGFLTGTNDFLSVDLRAKNLHSKITKTEQEAYLLSACEKNPEADFSRVAFQLLELIRASDRLTPLLR